MPICFLPIFLFVCLLECVCVHMSVYRYILLGIAGCYFFTILQISCSVAYLHSLWSLLLNQVLNVVKLLSFLLRLEEILPFCV